MPNLVTSDDVANLLPVTKANIHTSACLYKKEHGVYPSWYIGDGARGATRTWIDLDILEEQSKLLKQCWLLSTDYLYWWITDKMKMTQHQLSTEMAKRSQRFNTVGTWESFFNQGLFNLPQDVVLIERNSRLREFTIYGIAMVLAHKARPVLHMPH
jgi:hypothetical protein